MCETAVSKISLQSITCSYYYYKLYSTWVLFLHSACFFQYYRMRQQKQMPDLICKCTRSHTDWFAPIEVFDTIWENFSFRTIYINRPHFAEAETEQGGSHSENVVFEYRPRHRLSWMKFVVILLSSSKKKPVRIPKLGQYASFYIFPNSLFTNRHALQSYTVCA
jgi:hypothetical protein